jgi:chemotaxis protein methyltransferase CheR
MNCQPRNLDKNGVPEFVMKGQLLENFISLIATHTGLRFTAGDYKGLEQKLLARLAVRKCPLPEDYLQLLRQETPESAAEWQELATLLTTGETYFFRD